METVLSGAPRPQLEDYIITDGLSRELIDCLSDYLLSLRCSELTKQLYLQRLRQFGLWLTENGVVSYNNVTKMDIEKYLVKYEKQSTKNAHITALKPFYRHLGKPELVKKVKFYNVRLEPITPSDLLTLDEVIQLAEKAGQRRDKYKVIVLTLFESCARIAEALHLKVGDVQFSSVIDKEAHRKLVATLYFKRNKGGVKK